jgi:hypothetical protein
VRHLPPHNNIDSSVTERDVYFSGFVKMIYGDDCHVVCLAISSCGRKRGSLLFHSRHADQISFTTLYSIVLSVSRCVESIDPWMVSRSVGRKAIILIRRTTTIKHRLWWTCQGLEEDANRHLRDIRLACSVSPCTERSCLVMFLGCCCCSSPLITDIVGRGGQ